MALEHRPDEVALAEQFSEGLTRGAFNCQLQPYQPLTIRARRVSGELIAYASPDSTFAVTKALLDSAQQSILIGIYDFTAPHVKELLLRALRRGVKVGLMLDLDGRTGEQAVFDELKRFGVEAVPAPSCNSRRARFFAVAHLKVIVVDGLWTLVQSGNYSNNSIPPNESDGGTQPAFFPGNRDMGLAIRSRPLATFFNTLLRSDMHLELSGPAPRGLEPPTVPIEVLMPAPSRQPLRLFPSLRLTPAAPVSVTPVLSPDNYMKVVPDLLARATTSIAIEQQYIRASQPQIRRLLEAIKTARQRRPGLSIRIVLALPIGGVQAATREAENLARLASDFDLRAGEHIRFLSRERFTHCHNKLVVVDGQQVLVGSQNWSDAAVTKNREVSLLVKLPELARYYTTIFDDDWQTGEQQLRPRAERFLPLVELASGQAVPLEIGDYIEV